MKLVKRVFSATSAAVLGLSTLMTIGFTGVAVADTGTCTWTGSGGNTNFSTAGNWSGCGGTAPASGASLVFNSSILSSDQTLNNDISSLQIANITIQGSADHRFTIDGNPITLALGISSPDDSYGTAFNLDITLGGNVTIASYGLNGALDLNGHNLTVADGGYPWLKSLTGTGNVDVTNGGTLFLIDEASSWQGNLTIGSGGQARIGASMLSSSNQVTVSDGGGLVFCGFNGGNFPAPITVGGDGGLSTAPSCSGGGPASELNPVASVTLTGAVALTSNVIVYGSGELKITGALSGNYTITQVGGSAGKVTIASSNNTSATPNGTQASAKVTTTYSDSKPSESLTIEANNIAILDGTRADVSVSSSAELKGTGTMNTLNVASGGTVAPGHSPGKLTVLQTLTLSSGSTYAAELQTKDAYDQLQVSDPSRTSGQDVVLAGATLSASLYDGFKMAAGDTFTIINNLQPASQAVSGTFANLPEGATFKVGNGVFKISYVGGDGNDVVLTVVTAPATPDTGFAFVGTNPAILLGGAVLAAGAILLVARKMRPAPVRARATARRR